MPSFTSRSGKVKVTVVSEHGKEAVVAILGRADFFGEGCLTGQPRRPTATAMTVSKVIAAGKGRHGACAP